MKLILKDRNGMRTAELEGSSKEIMRLIAGLGYNWCIVSKKA